MIFVTVGTHEQQFNRLVEFMDNWAKNNDEEVVIQYGYSTYVPKFCEAKDIFSYEEMLKCFENARIVISHGGPSSFITALSYGKIPIVVPRKSEFNEHVNDHQVSFCKIVSERLSNIILVNDVECISDIINSYDHYVCNMSKGLKSNNERFNIELERIVNNLVGGI